MKKLCVIVSVFILILISVNCDPGNGGNGSEQPTEVVKTPSVTSIFPASRVINMSDFLLTVRGDDFINASKIVFNGAERDTSFVSSTEITCQIETKDLDSANQHLQTFGTLHEATESTFSVLVRNPSNLGGESNSMNFSVASKHRFTMPAQLSLGDNTRGSSDPEPDITIDGERNIHVVWKKSKIRLSSSSDQGNSWSQPDDINDDFENGGVRIKSDWNNNILYLSYIDEAPWNESGYSYCIRKSQDNGATWDASQILQEPLSGSSNHTLSVGQDGNVYAAWTCFFSNTFSRGIYFSKSTNHGKSWQKPKKITEISAYSISPNMVTSSNGDLYIAVTNFSYIMVHSSSDTGKTWDSGFEISSRKKSAKRCDIAVDEKGNIFAAWLGESNSKYGIYFNKKQEGNSEWDVPKKIFSASAGYWKPDIIADSRGNINIIWASDTSGSNKLYFSHSSDKGETWEKPTSISTVYTKWCFAPIAIVLDPDDNIFLCWGDGEMNDCDIYFARSGAE